MNATTLFLLGCALGVLTALLLAMAGLAVALAESEAAGVFFYTGFVTLFVAGLLAFGFGGKPSRMKRADTTVLMLLIWALLPAFAAIPFYLSDQYATFARAYFEAVSGLTTTGATTVEDLARLDSSLLVWRATLQMFGGAVTLLTVVLVLAPFDAATSPSNSTIPGYEEGDLTKSIVSSGREILPIYFTIIGFVLVFLWLAGLPGRDALIYAFTSVSTGGFTSGNGGLAFHDSLVAEIVVSVGMLLGATSFLAHRSGMLRLPSGGHGDTRESLIVLVLVPVCSVVLILVMWPQDAPAVETLRRGVFRTVSLLTTTGLDNAPPSAPAVPFVYILALIMVGGASFSTAGGVKVFRASTMFAQAHREIRRLIHPRGVSGSRAAGRTFDIRIMKAVWALFVVFLVSAGGVALILGFAGEEYEVSVMAAVAALSNTGPALGMALDVGGGPAEGYAEMSAVSLLALCVGMILGKVEYLAVLGLAGWWWHRVR